MKILTIVVVLYLCLITTNSYAEVIVGKVNVLESDSHDYKVEMFTTYKNTTTKTFKLVTVKCAVYDKDGKVIGLINTNFIMNALPGTEDVASGRDWINGAEPKHVRCFCKEQ